MAKNSTVIDLSAGDAFTNFLSASPSPVVNNLTNSSGTKDDGKQNVAPLIIDNDPSLSLAKEEQDFFNQVPTEKEKTKMTKDSIMALYGSAPPSSNPTNILGQFNGTIGAGVGFNQFNSPITGCYTTNPHQQIHATPNLYGGQIPSIPNQAFGCTPAPIANLFGATYQQQSQLLTQQQVPQQQQQPQQQIQFANFPPLVGSVGNSTGIASVPSGQSFQMQQTFAIQPTAAVAPTNGTLNQKFANLNVWQ